MKISFVIPGTSGHAEHLQRGLLYLKKWPFKLHFDETQLIDDEPDWPFASASASKRWSSLQSALLDAECQIIWAARGGYGCSEILPYWDFEQLQPQKPKLLVGFSDVCALQSAVYHRLGWLSLHAPMLASTLWQSEEGTLALEKTLDVLSGKATAIEIPLQNILNTTALYKGKLFGGCLSVLTNLIGTPYLPANLAGHILFFEDIDENPGRLWRQLLQWQQGGLLQGVKAIVLGDCVRCFPEAEMRETLLRRLHNLTGIPVFSSDFFGHISSNWPMMVGAKAEIQGNMLRWSVAQGDFHGT